MFTQSNFEILASGLRCCSIVPRTFARTSQHSISSHTMYWTVHLYGGPRRVNHAAVVIRSTIFTFGGYCSGLDYNYLRPIDIHILDTGNRFKFFYKFLPLCVTWCNVLIPEKLTWRKLDPVVDKSNRDCTPFQRYGHTAVAYGSKIYLWGGRNDRQVCNTLYCFDTGE